LQSEGSDVTAASFTFALGIFSFIDKTFVTFWWKKEPFLRQALKAMMEDRKSCH
jgi:hypothetical protein